MNAKDLMLGDWVQQTDPIHNGEPMQVKELRIIHCQDGNDIYLVCDETADVSEELVAPIPHTTEIISGIYRCPNMTIQWDDRLTEESGEYWYELSINDGTGISLTLQLRYVHELQHAMRLCGIDNEVIKL